MGQPALNTPWTGPQLQPTPLALVTLALMEDESRVLNHNYVGVEHLLLGMLRQGDGPGHDVLTRLGVSLDPARRALMQWLAET